MWKDEQDSNLTNRHDWTLWAADHVTIWCRYCIPVLSCILHNVSTLCLHPHRNLNQGPLFLKVTSTQNSNRSNSIEKLTNNKKCRKKRAERSILQWSLNFLHEHRVTALKEVVIREEKLEEKPIYPEQQGRMVKWTEEKRKSLGETARKSHYLNSNGRHNATMKTLTFFNGR